MDIYEKLESIFVPHPCICTYASRKCFSCEAMVNYLSERPGFTKEQAAYSGIAWSLFIVNTIAAIIFLLLIMPNKKFMHVFKGKRASWGSVILWGCSVSSSQWADKCSPPQLSQCLALARF